VERINVRIELSPSDEANYNKLHAAMRRAGFSRITTNDEGKEFRLPHAEYEFTLADVPPLAEILERARSAMQTERSPKTFAIRVSKASETVYDCLSEDVTAVKQEENEIMSKLRDSRRRR
jgi:hypothetical protein